MRAPDSQKFSNISATTSYFTLYGGYYKLAVVATWGGGSVKLYMLGPNDVALEVDSTNTSFTADGHGNAALPPGQYRLTVATASAIYASIVRIPGD